MTEVKELLGKRTQAKKKKPGFVRKDHRKKKGLAKLWRRPRGLHNKQRLKKKGHVKNPSSGYRVPAKVRGLHKSGVRPVIISNIGQLESLTKKDGVLLSSRIGDKKRKLLIEELKKKGFPLLNLDADVTITKIDEKVRERQEKKKKKTAEVKKKKGIEEKVKKAEKTKEKPEEDKKEELAEDEKKKLEKQEKDKLLTKRT